MPFCSFPLLSHTFWSYSIDLHSQNIVHNFPHLQVLSRTIKNTVLAYPSFCYSKVRMPMITNRKHSESAFLLFEVNQANLLPHLWTIPSKTKCYQSLRRAKSIRNILAFRWWFLAFWWLFRTHLHWEADCTLWLFLSFLPLSFPAESASWSSLCHLAVAFMDSLRADGCFRYLCCDLGVSPFVIIMERWLNGSINNRFGLNSLRII